jgi:hypothetical protein
MRCTENYIEEERHGGKQELGDCRGVRGYTELGACPICGGQKGWSRTPRCEGTIFWTRGLGMSKQT